MASKFQKFPEQMTSRQMNNQFLQRSAPINPLQTFGNLHMLNSNNCGPPLSMSYLQNGQQSGRVPIVNRASPPPLPARDDIIMNRQYGFGNSGLNNYYSPYGMRRFVPGMHNPGFYSPYSNFRSPYGPYGVPDDPYNSFLQMAEESTRPAFESIESVVQVVNSISMMLESTYGAIYGSYSAILGVLSQFSQLKTHFAEVLSILSLVKGLRWLCLKVLYLLGLRKLNPSDDIAWRSAHNAAINGELSPQSKRSAWPFFMFLSLVIGAPWLIFKLLAKSVAAKPPIDPSLWKFENNQVPVVVAAYDYNAARAGDLSVRAGQKLVLCPKDINSQNNWLLVANEQGEAGLVPKNYLQNVLTARQQRVPNAASETKAQPQMSNVASGNSQPQMSNVASSNAQQVSHQMSVPQVIPNRVTVPQVIPNRVTVPQVAPNAMPRPQVSNAEPITGFQPEAFNKALSAISVNLPTRSQPPMADSAAVDESMVSVPKLNPTKEIAPSSGENYGEEVNPVKNDSDQSNQ